jgi:predicted amidohydrolase
MRIKASGLLLGTTCLIVLATTWTASAIDQPQTLKVGIAQIALEPTLAANRDKIVHFIHEAKDRGCRVVVFPETALYWPPATLKTEIDDAVELLRKAVDASDIYALIGGLYKRDEKEKPFERLLVFDPEGRIVQTYNKMWHDARFNDCPGLFQIDGVSCAATLCADRWIRSVEELPAMAGAKILFECSNNYDNEWLPDLGWYWYVPRALRNEVFVVFANTAKEDRGQLTPGHGHSALIGPDGAILASVGEESDKLLVAELDLSRAIGGQALSRRNHPVFKPFWETGVALLGGHSAAGPAHRSLVSPQVELKIAAAQLACSREVSDNVQGIEKLVREAKSNDADVVVFPELAVTGSREEDIRLATQQQLAVALAKLQQAAKQSQIYLVCGLPWLDSDKRQNCAVAIGPDGTLLTRYPQLVVDRPKLFAAGTSSRSMWFDVKGVPCVMSVGHDALWSEMAEMAACRGAQVHLHLAYDRDTSPAGRLKRDQLWVNLASFRTFTATVNAASPAGLAEPSEPASGGSAIWDDYHRASSGQAGGYVPHSAVRLARAKETETILYATQRVQKTNPQFGILTEKTNAPMTHWYATGAQAIYAEAPQPGPFVDGKFGGRIAYSADGNHNDPDDWAASPVALAIFAEAGLKDRLVHFDYNCILPETNPEWEKTHAESVLGAANRYGYQPAAFFDCRKNLEQAVASLAKEIDASSAENPLYFIVAGPMEMPYLGIQRSRPEKRMFVYCISHSRWNDGYASKYKFTHTKRSVIDLGVNWVQIRDQNPLLSTSPYGQPAKPETWQPWHWMRDSADAEVRFLWERMQVSTRPDPSDAGMAFFLVTGDEEADPAKLQRLLDGHVRPQQIAERKRIRLEAENFRELAGFEVEDRNDRNVSHRLSVKPSQAGVGRITTQFAEPFAASRARYDVDVRHAAIGPERSQFTLLINGKPQGAGWESSGNNQAWATHTVSDVEIGEGDEIAIEIRGAGGRLDYVQLNQR